MRNVRGKYPDPHARLQVSTCSGRNYEWVNVDQVSVAHEPIHGRGYFPHRVAGWLTLFLHSQPFSAKFTRFPRPPK